MCRRVDACDGCEGAEADGDAQATDGDDSGTRALEQSKNDAGPVDEPGIDEQYFRAWHARIGLRDIWRVFYLFR